MDNLTPKEAFKSFIRSNGTIYWIEEKTEVGFIITLVYLLSLPNRATIKQWKLICAELEKKLVS